MISPRQDYTVAELIESARSFRAQIRAIRWPLMALLMLGSVGSMAWAWMAKPIYTARASFIFKEDANAGLMAGLSGLGALLGGGTTASSYSSLDRIVELSGSDFIVGRSLLENVSVDGQRDLLINHYIKAHNLRQTRKWQNDSLLVKAELDTNARYESLDQRQRQAVNYVGKLIRGTKALPDGILTVAFDKKSAMVHLVVEDTHEELAVRLNQPLYQHLVRFYTAQATSVLESRVRTLQLKADSISNQLSQTQSASARTTDQAYGLIRQSDKVSQKQLVVRENMLIMMYGEVIKNLEQLQFLLHSNTPSFTLIDQPYLPIKPTLKKPWAYGLTGLAFGAVTMFIGLAVSFVVFMTRPNARNSSSES